MMRTIHLFGMILVIGTAAQASRISPRDEAVAIEIAEKVSYLYEPGDPVPGWNRNGVDLLKMLDRSPGGRSGSAVITMDGESGERTVSYYDSAFDPAMLPSDWTLIMESGSMPTSASGNVVSITPLEGPYVLVESLPYTVKGTVFCGNAIGAFRLYRVPGRPAARGPQRGMIVAVRATEIASAGKIICERYRQSTGYLSVDLFTPEGQKLPALKGPIDDEVSIVPREPIASLLGY